MARGRNIRPLTFLLTVIAMTAIYARLTLADDGAASRPAVRHLAAASIAANHRIPAADTDRRPAAPPRGRRTTTSSLKAGAPRFVDIDLRAATAQPAPLRDAATTSHLAPAAAAPFRVRSPGTLGTAAAPLPTQAEESGDSAWSADRLLADATHMNDAYVSLARSPISGDLFAVFEAVDLGGTDRDIHIARSSDDGLTWTTLEMPSFSQDESMPEIAVDAAGYLHVVWVRDDGYIVRTRSSFPDDPTDWAWIKGLFTDSINATPSIAVTGAGDFATLFIAAGYQEINYDLMSWEWTLIWMWSTNAGNTVSFDSLVPDGFPDLWPGVAMDGARVHLINGEADVYGGPTKILLSSDAVSGGFADVTDLTAWTGFNAGFPDVACDGDAVYAVYQHDWDDGVGTIDGDIAVHLSFDAGATVDGPYEMVADDFDSIGPTVFARDGVVGCLWLEAPAGGDEYDVASRQAGGGGAPEYWPEVVETVTDLNLAQPMFHHLAGVVGDGRLHSAWIDRRDSPTQGHNVYTSDRPLLPNLAPVTPEGWDDVLVVSMTQGDRADGWLKADAPAYVSCALANIGFSAFEEAVRFELKVDGSVHTVFTWSGGLAPGAHVPVEDHPIELGAGPHMVELVIDTPDAVREESEDDNVATRQWVWIDGDPVLSLDPPNLRHVESAPLAARASQLAADPPSLRRRSLPVIAPDLAAASFAAKSTRLPVIIEPALRLDVAALDIRTADAAPDLRLAAAAAAGRNVLASARAELAPLLDDLVRSGSASAPRDLWLAGAVAADLDAAAIAALADDPAVGRLWLDDRPSATFGDAAELVDKAVEEWHLEAVGAQTAWALGYDGDGILVGHIDSGAAYDHPDLAGRLWDGGAAWPNHGWDSVDEDDDPYEGDPTWGHGTHTAGLVAGTGAAGRATGSAPGAELMILRAVPGYWSDLVEAMQFGLDNGPVDLFTMSAGWDAPSDDLKEASRATAELLLTAGIPWICAAGNGDNVGGHHPAPTDIAAPGVCPNPWYGAAGHSAVITIGAVGVDDAPWSGSSLGPTSWDIAAPGYDDYPYPPGLIKPDLAAPGDLVTSLAADGGYTTYSGTSMACPVAAGAAAILMQASPGVGPVDLARALETTAVDLGAAGRDNVTGAGRIDLAAALDALPRAARARSVVHNGGPLPLHLGALAWNAGWIDATLSSSVVAPGDSAFLLLEFDTAGLPAGYYSDVVVIPSNDPDGPHHLGVVLSIGDVTSVNDTPPVRAAIVGAPNPFNPRTELRFDVARAGPVRLTIHDLRGARVRTLIAGDLPAGPAVARWNGRDDAGRDLPTGLYLARLAAPGAPESTAKLTLLR